MDVAELPSEESGSVLLSGVCELGAGPELLV